MANMTLESIATRLGEIQADIQARDAQMDDKTMTDYETEIAELKEERTKLIAANERRARILDDIAAGAGEPDTSFVPQGNQRRNADDDPFATIEYRKAFKDYVLRGTPIPGKYTQYRTDAFNTTADASTGAVIPTMVLNQIVEKLESAGQILALVNRTNYKGGLMIPTSTVKPTASWVAERATSDKQAKTVAKSGMISFAYYKLRCAVAVSLEVDTMALSAFEAKVIANITFAMTDAIEKAIVAGTGMDQPKGILSETAPTGQVVECVTPAYQTLIDAEAALPEEYEAGAVWLMSKKTFMAFVGMVDNNGQPIARVDHGIAGAPERYLLGRQVITTRHAPSYTSTLAAGTIFAAIVNLSDYTLNTNLEMTIKQYEDNDTEDVVRKAVMLVDGKMVDKNSLVQLKKKAGG